MNVSLAIVSSREAIPSRRWEEETNSRGIPIGVGSGFGQTYRFVEGSTEIREAGVSFGGSSGEEDETIAMAVEMRCAITQPTIFSRRDEVAVGHCSRNR